MRTKDIRKKKIKVVTLGCSKNWVDSEQIVTQLRADELDVEHESGEDADVVIVNTCGFIDKAKEESIDTILAYADEKEHGNIEKLYVTGCLSERYKNDLEVEIPQVDAYFGTMDLPALLNKFEVDYKKDLVGERVTLTPQHYAYMKISEGCNRTCSFCAIPLMRKGHVSRPIESLVSEAKHFVKNGVREIMLIAQELTYYGLDIYKERKLADLLRELAKVEGLDWIRLHYAYPSKFPFEVLEVMRDHDNICNYLDIPLQHASNRVLQRMKRQITQEETQELIDKAREIVPNICLRTTMLLGFPGETEADIQEVLSFVEKNRFDRLGVFQYSHEEDTSAFELDDDVSDSDKVDRVNRLMALQQEISEELNQAKIGTTLKVLVDRVEDGVYYGRSESDSPEVDNEVIIEGADYLRLGDFVSVKVADALAYDLVGEVVS